MTGTQLGKMGTCGRNTIWRSTSKETKLPSLCVHAYVHRTLFGCLLIFTLCSNLPYTHSFLHCPLLHHSLTWKFLFSRPPFPLPPWRNSHVCSPCVFHVPTSSETPEVCLEPRPDLLTQNLS